MKDYIRDFIKKYEEEIDKDNFLRVYTAAADHFNLITDISELTTIFESASIYPLEHMNIVPMYYYAFSDEDVLEVYSNTIKVIYDSAFEMCHNLTTVTIPRSVNMISPRAFIGCHQLKYFQYEGTKEEFEKIKGLNDVFWEDHPGFQILCMATGEVIKK